MENSLIIPGNLYVFKNLSKPQYKATYQFRLTIYNSKLTKIINKLRLKNINNMRVDVSYFNNLFNIRRSNSGAKLYPRIKHQYSCLSVANYLDTSLKKNLISKIKNQSYSEKVRIRLNPKELGLNKEDIFLDSKQENELAKELILNKYNLFVIGKNNNNKFDSGCADILIRYNNFEIPIEITTIKPIRDFLKKGLNAPHGYVWLKVAGRILPVLMYSINKESKSFVIIHKKWQKYGHVRDLTKRFKSFKCKILFTDFNENWVKNMVVKIDNELKR